jgi:MFS superfamily sulfate permease-like transporter
MLGAPLSSLFVGKYKVVHTEEGAIVSLPVTCYFGNIIAFKRLIREVSSNRVTFDFSHTVHVDHTFMYELRALECNWGQEGRAIKLKNFDKLVPVSPHHAATRRVCHRDGILSGALAHR